MELQFTTLDVFTTTPYEGNPLAIVRIPSYLRVKLSAKQKQTIAREFNLSETVFLHEPSGEKPEWNIEIFTTNDELPFAGHPTIGSACYVLNMQSSPSPSIGALVTKAGPIVISLSGQGKVQADIPHDVRIHRHTIDDLQAPIAGLSSHPVLAEAEKKAPLVSIVKGMTFLLVRLESLEMLVEVHSTSRHLSFYQLLDEDWEAGFVARYYYVLESRYTSEHGNRNSKGKEVNVTRIRTRMLEMTMEDPATGSAACALGSYLAMMGKGVDVGEGVGRYEITQGVEMGRRSVIGVDVMVEAGGKKIKSVRLSGSAVKVMEGRLRI